MKKIISILICIQIALFPALAFAANVGGWSMGNPVAQGASTVYEGSKNVIINGADYVKKGTAKITPNAANVAKTLGKGVAGVAVSVAVEQLLGAVDWVLDPANNQAKYYEQGSGLYVNHNGVKYTNLNDYCIARLGNANPNDFAHSYYKISSDSKYIRCYIIDKRSQPWDYDYYNATGVVVQGEKEEKTIPLTSIASQVITNAESETDTEKKVAAQAVTLAAAADIVAEAETDSTKARPIAQELEATSTTKPADEAAAAQANTATGTQTQNPTKPGTTDLALEFPAFCGWAPVVCEAAQVVISLPQTLTDWWEAVKEWATAEPDLKEDPTDLPLEDSSPDRDPSSFDTDYIVLGAQCPTFEPYTVSVGPVSETLSFDLMPLCQFAEKVRPAILGMSYLTAAGIVIAAIRES